MTDRVAYLEGWYVVPGARRFRKLLEALQANMVNLAETADGRHITTNRY